LTNSIRRFQPLMRRFTSLIAVFLLILAFPLSSSATENAPAHPRFDLSSIECTLPLPERLIPGGMPFGIQMNVKGVWVVGFSDVLNEKGQSFCPARECGLQSGDLIRSIDGAEAVSASQVTAIIENSAGKTLSVLINRDSTALTLHLTPICSSHDGIYRAGFWIRDTTSGIGTLTYIDPATGAFGGLGHGVCQSGGSLIPFASGSSMEVQISGAVKGRPGAPGELKGFFRSRRTGTLLSNLDEGVFGIFGELPVDCPESVAVAPATDVKLGNAIIYCTIGDEGRRGYDIRIDAIHTGINQRNMEITVTDPVLLELTGGIVQGMSGSPILQDGKLVGAVTHVLVNNPSAGYGIFIENMLNAAQLPVARIS